MSATAAARVCLERRGAVAVVTLDNPPVNALAEPLLRQLADTVAVLRTDPEVRVVLVTGAGERAFAAGADLPELRGILSNRDALLAHTALTREVFDGIATLPQPVVGVAAGTAVGGGFELLLACDFAVVDERARLGLPEVKLGLIPGAGGTQRLARRIGTAAALRMVLLGELIAARKAVELGAITDVAPAGEALESGERLAERLATLPAVALRAAKAVVREGAELALDCALDHERVAFLAVARSNDARIGVDAFIAAAEPQFTHH